MREELRRACGWIALTAAVQTAPAPVLERYCTECHRGSPATQGLAQGVRNMAQVPDDAAQRFVEDHLEALTGRTPKAEETRAIVEAIRDAAPAQPLRKPSAPPGT